MEPSGVRILNAPQADEKFDASVFGARGRRWQAIEADLLRHQIRQGAGIDVLEVKMGFGVGIKPGTGTLRGELTDHALFSEQVECVVHRGLRDPYTPTLQRDEDLLCRQVLRRTKQQGGDLQSLRGRLNARCAQALGDRIRIG